MTVKHPMNEKQELRKTLRQRRPYGLPGEASVLRQLLDNVPQVRWARVIMAYCALPDEVSLEPLFSKWLAEGKRIVLPRVTGDTTMELCSYLGADQLQPGAFGIMEPTGALFTDCDQIDVAVVPGMAFDRDGHRLGRGKGYYDRFLPQLPQAYKIGICFRSQLLDGVPTSNHDIIMDCIVAE